jgi:pimeloyl-ACP methyl ester carboxylesterase
MEMVEVSILWQVLYPYFSQLYKVIAVDSRAQGKTTDISDSLSFEMMADDEAALLDQMHIAQVSAVKKQR